MKNYQKIYLPITVCGELLFGAKNSAKREVNEKKFWQFIDSCFILNINELVANEYAEVRKSLKDKGRPLPENDIWIAATKLAFLDNFSFSESREILKNLKGSLSDIVIEERRD